MEEVSLKVLPLLGFIGGFIAGLLGLGGGVIMLPLLAFVGKIPLMISTGIGLVHVAAAAGVGLASHLREGKVDLKAGFLIGISGIAGGWAGSFLSVSLSDRFLQYIYLLVVGAAASMLFIPLPVEEIEYQKGRFPKAAGVLIGLCVGSLAGLLGVAGGFILVPLMIYILKIPMQITIGTSLLVGLISSIGTIGAKIGVGHVHPLMTLLVVSGSVIGAFCGAYASRRTPVRHLRLFLLSMLILIFIGVGYKTFF